MDRKPGAVPQRRVTRSELHAYWRAVVCLETGSQDLQRKHLRSLGFGIGGRAIIVREKSQQEIGCLACLRGGADDGPVVLAQHLRHDAM